MDNSLIMDKLFKFLREFPEFKSLMDMEYDEKNNFVRAKMGNTEKIIEIHDNSNWMSICKEVLEWFGG